MKNKTFTVIGTMTSCIKIKNSPLSKRANDPSSWMPRWFVAVRTKDGIFFAETAANSPVNYFIDGCVGFCDGFDCHITKKRRIIIDAVNYQAMKNSKDLPDDLYECKKNR